MVKKKITAVVLAKNEEKNLSLCLKKLVWVDEIIVVDDYSEDKTVEIARKFGARIFQRKLDDFAAQRNFALKRVETEWVLLVDPDERVTPTLASEIQGAIKKNNYAGFYFPRKNIIFGRWVKHSGWYPDWQLHLFKTRKGKYFEKVHEQVEIEGKVGYLKNNLIHYNFTDIGHFLSKRKFELYASLEAEHLLDRGYKFTWIDLVSKPTEEFLRRFFAEKGYLDGILGLILAGLQAAKEFVIYAMIWEKQGKKEAKISPQKMIGEFDEQLKKRGKEINFWLLTTQIDQEANFWRRMWLRLKRKTCFR